MMNSLPFPGTCAARAHGAVVHLDEAAHDRQPEAEAARRAVQCLRLLHEDIEHLLEHLRGDSHAFIAHAQLDARTGAARVHADRGAWVAVFGGVGEEVHQHLREPLRVGKDQQPRGRHVDLAGDGSAG